MKQLPDKIKNIDVLRIQYGRRKVCNCTTPAYEIDYQNRLVYCQGCMAIVEPFEALLKMAKHFEGIQSQVNQLLEQKREIERYKPRLVVIKEIEKNYNSGEMLPVCPKCAEVFDLKDVTVWKNKRYCEVKDE